MSLDTLDTKAINFVFDGYGFTSDVSYTPEGGDAITIPSLYSLLENPFEDGRYRGKGMDAYVRASDVAVPAIGDTITISTGEVYIVRGIEPSSDGKVWKLRLTSNVRATA